ncbi:hypothetical protein BH11MYX4_BH11MYX4_57570 [soil metagenome]
MSSPRKAKFLLGALVALALGGCSLLFPTTKEQCSGDGDCQARGAAFESTHCSPQNVCVPSEQVVRDAAAGDAAEGGPFACANLPAPSPDPSRPVDLSIRYTDFSSGAPPTVVSARLCAATDPNCLNPRRSVEGAGPADAGPEGGDGWVVPKADGSLSAKVEFGFEGFFQAGGPGYETIYRSTSPALRKPTTVIDQLLLRSADVKFLADEALKMPNAFESVGHGLVFVFAEDCDGHPMESVSFTTSAVDPLMKLFYVINSAPSVEDTKTDSLGRGGFVNVPPGIHTFHGFVGQGANQRRFGSTRMLIRPGVGTVLVVAPSP